MTQEKKEIIKEIIREELAQLIRSDRYTFHKLIQILDGRNIQLGKTTGTKFGTEGGSTGQKIGFFSATPVVEPSSTGETTGFTAGAGTAVNDASTFTGNVGSTAYRISDVVKHLKNLGLIAE